MCDGAVGVDDGLVTRHQEDAVNNRGRKREEECVVKISSHLTVFTPARYEVVRGWVAAAKAVETSAAQGEGHRIMPFPDTFFVFGDMVVLRQFGKHERHDVCDKNTYKWPQKWQLLAAKAV